MNALVSIHDVMPHTMPRVAALIDSLRHQGHDAITLLVVPGLAWQDEHIDTLAHWQQSGIELAAHGWRHHAPRLGGPYHRLHAALISRRAAEHLALDGRGIDMLMRRSAAWFSKQGLGAPSTYVPPAWALGAIPKTKLQTQPYRRIEVTRGLLDPQSGRLDSLPLVGFEADTAWRERVLRQWNRTQVWQARRRNRPLRIGIHPYDPELRLAEDMQRLLAGDWQSRRYDQRHLN
ncbi:polysaccharide deacetylase family protein [Aidingimonas lacisalsi]|uniref:polysaccharide deacetylase family protein n=1 Tax=Aidingimonas lacisalsi TaxID=2604086 RepID=UPI00191C3A52|nr:polysaccharide deacetylase family protein [Aidingimonas lacisalsi]